MVDKRCCPSELDTNRGRFRTQGALQSGVTLPEVSRGYEWLDPRNRQRPWLEVQPISNVCNPDKGTRVVCATLKYLVACPANDRGRLRYDHRYLAIERFRGPRDFANRLSQRSRSLAGERRATWPSHQHQTDGLTCPRIHHERARCCVAVRHMAALYLVLSRFGTIPPKARDGFFRRWLSDLIASMYSGSSELTWATGTYPSCRYARLNSIVCSKQARCSSGDILGVGMMSQGIGFQSGRASTANAL